MELLIKNARIIDVTQDFHGDIYIKDGIINEVGKSITKDNVQILDCEGKIVMPAFIDTHAHFRDPGLTWKEDIETGSKAALKGGYTGVCLMANTRPICSSKETLEFVRNRSKELNLIEVHQCLSITKNFDGITLDHLKDLEDDKEIKAISDDGVGVANSNTMLEAMKIAKKNNWVIMSHAESPEFSKVDMRIAENMMTLRDIELAKLSGARLHMCHVSTEEAVKYIIEGKMSGANITMEITPHHIGLTRDINDYRVNPPIREKEDVEAIIKAIKLGMVDTIGTDHAPHTAEEKKNGSPGMVGLETAFSICYTKLVKDNNVSLNKLSELMSYNSAKLLGMNKGKISVGADGDLVVIDTENKIKINPEEFESKGKNTPFVGMEFYGQVLTTIKGGEIKFNSVNK
ncbi:dihydroorotase [Clostridium saccharoperbutylacetonicum]|uniref:Dihydroorotase PyrC n=1 Tax=Clostridium saccharoperbutylacetonicum N1-4(HMT) TaxID=931276 RepID=M1MA95_9CLOT|nr:dihydroorotase [Clostridium saccharoperbutylacetonicum]AGF54864.1 dihydroorotase PyrC [Clostridium saccharoperbutylacetonicum N1-4(HMT)]AQR93785.1 dihydroorotase [Clostridium saccharoperbutylacetonicum]NRT64431.1 dihydroorotase [Clostridium saccharoperbutylacetonicum]NSB27802.1 dihydroorotase [Clostridium saccharoperbutylacetonicum]NSB29485.1 dihydroorotase [Clostridium saccharoperbutylacetonicum]